MRIRRLEEMNAPSLLQMEEGISQLSLDEQLWLMERLIRRIREQEVPMSADEELLTMANDPEIQHELRIYEAC